MTASLRDAREPDLPELIALEAETFGAAAWSAALVTDEFLHGTTRFRIADDAGVILGYAVYGFDGDAFHLMNLAVVPAARRRGLARLLVADFLSEARRWGATEAWLEVAATNEPAIALYREVGFADVRVRPKYYQPGDVDAIVMRVALG